MQAVLSPKAQKQYDKLNEPIKSRIKKGLDNLEKDPPQGDIIETDLTDEEKTIVADGREEYAANSQRFVPLSALK